MDEFEQKLSRQTFREVPEHWKGEIISAANPANKFQEKSFFHELFITFRWGWTGMTTIWLILLAFSNSESAPGYEVAESDSRKAIESMAQNHKDINQLLAYERFAPVEAHLRPRSDRTTNDQNLGLTYA